MEEIGSERGRRRTCALRWHRRGGDTRAERPPDPPDEPDRVTEGPPKTAAEIKLAKKRQKLARGEEELAAMKSKRQRKEAKAESRRWREKVWTKLGIGVAVAAVALAAITLVVLLTLVCIEPDRLPDFLGGIAAATTAIGGAGIGGYRHWRKRKSDPDHADDR